MKKMISKSLLSFAGLAAILALLAAPSPLFAKQGVHIVGDEILVEETEETAVPDDSIDGPLLDKMSDSGTLYGDLYRLARYKGGEVKKVPAVNPSTGLPEYDTIQWTDPDGGTHQISVQKLTDKTATGEDIKAVGGEPILTEDYASVPVDEEVTVEPGMIVVTSPVGNQYIVSPFPSQCVQPVAEEKWGLPGNLIPLLKTYDATWQRTECEADPNIFIAVDRDDAESPILTLVTLADGITYNIDQDIYYADLVQEVEFGRLNLARAPQAVLDASFDEAIRSLNAATDIKIDASGRFMVTTETYENEFLLEEVEVEINGEMVTTFKPLGWEVVTKAIDSPKENLALYLKLMKDGHLITPADQRAPIDYSVYGGIPINQLLELEDGPSDAPRPTIDIAKMREFGLGHLVDPGVTYDGEGNIVDNEIVTYYIKMAADGSLILDEEGNMVKSLTPCESCVEFTGLWTAFESSVCAEDDFPVAASFLAAAADKKGNITVDKIVYINSILGINKVVGYSEDGTINYAKNPVYFNYGAIPVYDRLDTYGNKELGYCNANRGQAQDTNGDGIVDLDDRNGDGSYSYDGMVELLEEIDDDSRIVWEQKYRYISERVFGDVNVDSSMTENIAGFNSMADDDLQVIITTHTYQIPGLR